MACLFGPSTLLAQEVDTTRVVEIPEVLVTVTRAPLEMRRAPYSITAFDRTRDDRARPGLALDEALRLVPGVQVDNRYNHALGERISVRGMGARAQFGVRGVKVLFDGIPATLPDGQTTLGHIDPAFVQRVEVLRGPASGLWGNAAGGVIQMSTVLPRGAGSRHQAGVTVGSDGLLRAGVESAGGSLDGAYLVQVSHLDFGGYREFNEARALRAHARGVYRIARLDGEVELVAGGVDYDAQNPGSLSEALLREDPGAAFPNNVRQRTGERGTQVHLGATWRGPAPGGSLEWSGYVVDREIENPIPPQIIDLERLAGGTRAVVHGTAPVGRAMLDWSAGVEAELQRDDRRNHANEEGVRGAITLDQRERVRGLATFAQLALSPTAGVTALAALRHDRFRFAAIDRLVTIENPDDSGVRHLGATSPSLGIALELSRRLRVHANATTSFETPTTTELANRPDGAGGFNPGLRPQRALSLEAGSRIAPAAGAALELTVFRLSLDDALVPYEVESAPGRQYFQNAGSAVHRGLEASAAAGLGGPTRFRAAYTFTDARFGDFTVDGADHSGNRVPGVAPHRLNLVLGRAIRRDGTLELAARHASAMAVDDANEHEAAASSVLDASAAVPVRLGRLRGSALLGVTNLADSRYVTSVVVNAFGGRYYEPGPGRSLYLGFTIGTPAGVRRTAPE
jgi:iron complex outermembrane receptor protein